MASLSDFLTEKVYPRLDLCDAGMLDAFNPVASKGARLSYTLTCPECKKARAGFYYPGNFVVHCSRKNNCGQPTRIWDAVQESTGLENKDLLKRLCELANVDPPGREDAAQPRGAVSLVEAIKQITRQALADSPEAMHYLTEVRRFSAEEIQKMGLGFYPSDKFIREALLEAKQDIGIAEQWALVQPPESREAKKRWGFEGRIVGFWKQIDGSLRLWSRDITAEGDGLPKYMFAPGTDKTQPYGWSGAAVRCPAVVEGTLDRESLQLMGINAVAIGQAGVNAAQAVFFVERGVMELVHMADGDRAGLRGAMDTIRHCEPLGITVYVALIPEGMDDVDKLRAGGQQAEAVALYQGATNAGELLANQLILAIDQRTTVQASRAVRELMALRANLTPVSALAFDRTLLRYGLQPVPLQAQALRLAANLLECGLLQEVVDKRVTALTGYTLQPAE